MKEKTEREHNSTRFENISGFKPIEKIQNNAESTNTVNEDEKSESSSLNSIVLIKCDSDLSEKKYQLHLDIDEHIKKERTLALNRRAIGKSPKTPSTSTPI